MGWIWLAAAALLSTSAMAQPSRAPEGERAPRPDSASNASVGGWCDALTGEKKEQCLRDERRKRDARAGDSVRGSCDRLTGPEKAQCVKRGGTLEVDAKTGASAGGSASEQ